MSLPGFFATPSAHSSSPTTLSSLTHYTITFTVPPSQLSACKTAIFSAGAGQHRHSLSKNPLDPPMYINCCFELHGKGQFIPCNNATPTIGEKGELEVLEEVRVEVECVGEEVVRRAVEALKGAHPYEVPVYKVFKQESF